MIYSIYFDNPVIFSMEMRKGSFQNNNRKNFGYVQLTMMDSIQTYMISVDEQYES
jgi:hypothetical protein